MEMHQVRYFLAVADELNFTRAAEKCNVAQPSLRASCSKTNSAGHYFIASGRTRIFPSLGEW